MRRILTPQIGRRHLVGGIAVAVAAPLLASGRLIAAGKLVATPRQTEGPFYPRDWSGDIDNDLVLVQGEAAKALGQITHVTGRVLDVTGAPVRGAVVEIWQCDANGVYRHPADESATHKRDSGFQSRGRIPTGADGGYSFRTIKPVAYPGRTPHIHFSVRAPQGRTLITQMYVAGEPLNERDGILQGIRDAKQRDSVIVRLEQADRLEAGALAGTFDIVLG